MRAVNIVLLVLAGALSGALVMKVMQRPVRVAVQPKQCAGLPFRREQAAPAANAARWKPNRLKSRKCNHRRQPSSRQRPGPSRSSSVCGKESHRPCAAFPTRSPLRCPCASCTRRRIAWNSSTPPQSHEIPPSPPVLPEQPKETPPARMEPENVTPPSAPIPSAPEPNQATLNAGMLIPVRLLDSLSSERNHAGDSFAATLYRELVANGFVIAERGARVEGRVTAVDRDART